MSRRCALAHDDAARAIIHDGLMHDHSVPAIARSVDRHRISQSAVRRYIRRYNRELLRLEMISAGGALGSAHAGLTSFDPDADQGSLVSCTELNVMIDMVVEGLDVATKRDVASKEARIRVDPASHLPRLGSRGLSQETVAAIRHQVLGMGD